MTPKTDAALYHKVVQVTQVYLGPAADRFIARQVQNHLQKEPESLRPTDLAKLISWLTIAVSLLTDNSEIVEEYTIQLQKLARQPIPKPKGNSL